jgi:Raf kinase inhibitor-like YbhB/YbcL family protein
MRFIHIALSQHGVELMLEKLPTGVGRVLQKARAGADELAIADTELTGVNAVIQVTSEAFAYGETLPQDCTSDGKGISPPLQWSGVPTDAEAVVLIMEDADSPTRRPLVHAIVWDLPGVDGELPAGMLSNPTPAVAESVGRNSYLSASYLPPDPPPGHGPHRYVFQVFALDQPVHFDSRPGRDALLDAIRDHVIAKGLLIGTYERH